VNGEAVVTAKPDRLELQLGVVTQAQSADAAAAQNASRVDAVLKALRPAVGAAGEVRTVSYSVQPNYNYPREGGKPAITGYTANNIVQVTTNDIDAAGKLIDLAMKAGANTVQRLQFTLREPEAARAEAVKQAVTKARAISEVMARSLRVKILGVYSAEEQGGGVPVRPMETMMARAEMAPGVPTPIESGTIEVRTNVLVTFLIGAL
jgi:uncharacterized protein YggE